MKHDKGYYDVDQEIEITLLEAGVLDPIFYLRDLKQRKLFLTEEINPFTVQEYVKHILQFNKEDTGIPAEERKPILLYLSSIGGDVASGFSLIDVIRNSVTPVYTINLNFQYSMGFLIGLAGHKRFATKNAQLLMHDGTSMIYNSGAKVHDQIEFNRRIEERIKEYVLARSKLTPEEYDNKFRVEWYLFADEAKKYGFVDSIIGEDCPIDAVI